MPRDDEMRGGHSLINTGAGWSCIRCRRAWDQGETAPEDCEPDAFPMNTVADLAGQTLSLHPALMASAEERLPDMIVKREPSFKHSIMTAQVAGSHYKGLPIQPTEFAQRNHLDFCVGSILKYVTRHRSKNGIEDLRKGRHFVEIREAFPLDIAPPGYRAITMLEYVTRNSIRPDDAEVLYRLEAYYNADGHANTRRCAERLIEEIDRLIAIAY